jgi:ADP-ribosylglycohydrolase|nr:MAG TPA: ADP-ribosylglycohydrolase [Caudoviricetes sp.]
MLGAIIGDIVGSRFEFNNVRSKNFKLFTNECSFTDDTICTVAVADAILTGKSYRDSVHEWCRKFPNPMGGYGGSFAQWVHSDNPQPYYSFGNGSAMRVSPIGLYFDNEFGDVMNEAEKSAQITHDHPEGIKGAQVTALCIWMVRKGYNKADMEAFIKSEYGAIPNFVPFSNPFDETCMNAVPVSVSCVLNSTSFEEAIRNAMMIGGDSDTIGAITGGIAEAMYGIPEYMEDIALSYLTDEMKNVVTKFYNKL